MKKQIIYFFSGALVFAVNLNALGGQNPQINRLLQQKQQKLAQLEQCAKKVNGFKIAGISTLGLTAAGVAGNIALASKSKTLEREISDTQTKIDTEKKKLDKINAKIATEKTKREGETFDGGDTDKTSDVNVANNNSSLTFNPFAQKQTYCYKELNGDKDTKQVCQNANLESGEWIIRYVEQTTPLKGVSICVEGKDVFNGRVPSTGIYVRPNENAFVQQEYESWVNLGRPEISNTANYCMCRVVSPYSGNMWVAGGVSFSGSACSTDCASRCASHAYTVKNADYWAHRETLGLEDAHD